MPFVEVHNGDTFDNMESYNIISNARRPTNFRYARVGKLLARNPHLLPRFKDLIKVQRKQT